jgi:hypothetical protein
MLRASCVVNVDAGVDDDGEDREEDGHLVDERNDVEDAMVAVWKFFLRVALHSFEDSLLSSLVTRCPLKVTTYNSPKRRRTSPSAGKAP